MSPLELLVLVAGLVLRPVELPPSVEPQAGSRLHGADYDRALTDPRFAMRRFDYESEGLKVFAYVYGPREPPAAALPVVVFNRGSWVRDEFAAEILRLAEAGYLVIAPFYRGSGGAPGTDEMGGADLADLFALVPIIEGIPGADPDKLFLYGESRGGMMVYQALRDGFPARAAALYGGFSDLAGMLADPHWEAIGHTIWPDLDERREEIVERRSAVRWADRIDVPVLVMHGSDDGAVPPDQALAMTSALIEADKTVELWLVAGGDHVLSNAAPERDSRAIAWFRKHETAASEPAGEE